MAILLSRALNESKKGLGIPRSDINRVKEMVRFDRFFSQDKNKIYNCTSHLICKRESIYPAKHNYQNK